MGRQKQREPSSGEIEVTEIRLVVLHPPSPFIGHDPMRKVLQALNEEPETIVLQNVQTSEDINIDIPKRLVKGE